MIGTEDIEALTQFFAELHTNDHPTQMEQLVQMLVESQRAQQEIGAAWLQQQIKASQLKEQELQQLPRPKPKAADFIPKLGETDNVEAFMHLKLQPLGRSVQRQSGLDPWLLFYQVRHLKLIKM
ncbi:hypothetical protein VZT92_001976 [Zoarces viviparus]|uniref:Uncharacterized protein n=1 Tax=Zoarces viviparus TaxID=48416 RepID=A0AAW1G456_ZOAVI